MQVRCGSVSLGPSCYYVKCQKSSQFTRVSRAAFLDLFTPQGISHQMAIRIAAIQRGGIFFGRDVARSLPVDAGMFNVRLRKTQMTGM